ncbi:hypothetical protein O181_044777 [Austropuccinia psidii MF-1]|uniref:Uncharacterized protein n=1 Tax=Austropuccinia psidii MF-1 TaxID=1389203 RepID=A0A9Q3HI38_9BASI|nr:hypothetical protein [Austropuccinia psidii MF-1]
MKLSQDRRREGKSLRVNVKIGKREEDQRSKIIVKDCWWQMGKEQMIGMWTWEKADHHLVSIAWHNKKTIHSNEAETGYYHQPNPIEAGGLTSVTAAGVGR